MCVCDGETEGGDGVGYWWCGGGLLGVLALLGSCRCARTREGIRFSVRLTKAHAGEGLGEIRVVDILVFTRLLPVPRGLGRSAGSC